MSTPNRQIRKCVDETTAKTSVLPILNIAFHNAASSSLMNHNQAGIQVTNQALICSVYKMFFFNIDPTSNKD